MARPAHSRALGEPWHQHPFEAVTARLGADPARGLTAADAARRLRRDGPNQLPRAERPSALRILSRQLAGVVVWVLLGAAAVALLLGERLDAAAILAIVVLHAGLGFVQESRAERAVAALAVLTAPRARVVRDGVPHDIPAAEVVRGDLLLLGAGDLVAADARLVEAPRLRTDEAALTGESEPVDKDPRPCPSGTPVADRRDMVFLGTSVVAGAGRAIVVETGTATELGRVAALLESAARPPTPLQVQLDVVGRRLLWACLAIVVAVVVLGVVRDRPTVELFLAAVSLAVAAIPEGLPAVVTIALAVGVQRMARRHALVRRLPAVETLGATEVICTDKTGTLTVGAMTARRVITWSRAFTVTGEGFDTEGTIIEAGTAVAAGDDPELAALLVSAVAASDARLGEADGRATVLGDPTEGALVVLAKKGAVDAAAIDAEHPRLVSIPFDPERRRMTVVCADAAGACAHVKGATEAILGRATHVRTRDGVVPLDETGRARLLEATAVLAGEALRVLAVAQRPLPGWPIGGDVEQDLVVLGLVGLQDPPRPEAREAVLACRRAGMRAVMITGDHPDTARAIAREVGILEHDDAVLAGVALDALDERALDEAVARTAVYARVTAEHKLRIVRAWQRRGAVVAMTGDGVNDAPALREADIGVAMGRTGTEVTKAAADMVLADDHVATIVAAVEEGRGIWDNVQKTLAYLVAGNAAELATMLVASVLGWPLPLLPIHLLWINLVTDGLPAVALATDATEPDVLARPPRRRNAALADRGTVARVLLTGALGAAVALVAFHATLRADGDLDAARDAAFTVLVCEELLRSFSARSAHRPLWRIGLLSNVRLVVIVLAGLGLQVALHHVPLLQEVFALEPVPGARWGVWLALAAVPLAALETVKARTRRA